MSAKVINITKLHFRGKILTSLKSKRCATFSNLRFSSWFELGKPNFSFSVQEHKCSWKYKLKAQKWLVIIEMRGKGAGKERNIVPFWFCWIMCEGREAPLSSQTGKTILTILNRHHIQGCAGHNWEGLEKSTSGYFLDCFQDIYRWLRKTAVYQYAMTAASVSWLVLLVIITSKSKCGFL